jgi:hypothetical protein
MLCSGRGSAFRSYILNQGFLEGFAGFTSRHGVGLRIPEVCEALGTKLERKDDGDRKRSSRRLRILHIDPEQRWGGGEAQVLGLLSYLAECGHRNDLLTHPEGRLFQQSQALNVGTMPLVLRNDLDLRPVPSSRRLIRHADYNIVHLHTKRAHALSFWLSHNALDQIRGDPENGLSRVKNWYTRCLYNRKVDGVIAISRKISELLVEAGVERERIA